MRSRLKVKVFDDEDGTFIGEFTLGADEYAVLCGGGRYVSRTTTAANTGTEVVYVAKRRPDNGGGDLVHAGPSGEGHGGTAD